MSKVAFISPISFKRLPLDVIDAVVSGRLGPTRIPGNSQPACFNRQVAMCMAKSVAGWSTTCIGRFYNGRDHSTVVHGIQRIEALRECDSRVDVLLSELKTLLAQVNEESHDLELTQMAIKDRRRQCVDMDEIVETVTEKVWARIEGRLKRSRDKTVVRSR